MPPTNKNKRSNSNANSSNAILELPTTSYIQFFPDKTQMHSLLARQCLNTREKLPEISRLYNVGITTVNDILQYQSGISDDLTSKQIQRLVQLVSQGMPFNDIPRPLRAKFLQVETEIQAQTFVPNKQITNNAFYFILDENEADILVIQNDTAEDSIKRVVTQTLPELQELLTVNYPVCGRILSALFFSIIKHLGNWMQDYPNERQTLTEVLAAIMNKTMQLNEHGYNPIRFLMAQLRNLRDIENCSDSAQAALDECGKITSEHSISVTLYTPHTHTPAAYYQ